MLFGILLYFLTAAVLWYEIFVPASHPEVGLASFRAVAVAIKSAFGRTYVYVKNCLYFWLYVKTVYTTNSAYVA